MACSALKQIPSTKSSVSPLMPISIYLPVRCRHRQPRSPSQCSQCCTVKATDENLTSENWALILDVCDRVSASPQGPSSAVAALIKRLSHRNANVQLYTLELANALSQNCGPPLHRELASRSFTDALLRLANDRNTHQQVKSKILERMHEWTEMFRGDADLGIMEQAYDKLRRGNPSLQPPSKPMKREIGDDDRRKEEEELQMALALSIRDKGASPSVSKTQDPSVSDSQPDTQPGAQAGTTAATVSRVKALYDFTPSEPGELAFRKGDIIAVLESVYKDWWKGSLRGQTGIFPLNYVEKLQDPTREELERDAAMEGEVFAQIRNVEKLLALLSVRGEGGVGGARDQASEEEITELYHQTLAIRPKLIELIGKYSQKKGERANIGVEVEAGLIHKQTTSLNSTKSSSKHAATTKLSSNPLCRKRLLGMARDHPNPTIMPTTRLSRKAIRHNKANKHHTHLPAQRKIISATTRLRHLSLHTALTATRQP